MAFRLSIEEQIAIHTSYRAIFNAPLSLTQLKEWIGASASSNGAFDDSVNKMILDGLIERQDDFICLFGNKDIIDKQVEKTEISKELKNRARPALEIMARSPFIRYIGISDSVAADNPTRDRKGVNAGNHDLDIFLVTSKNAMWLAYFPHRIFVNIKRALFKKHFFCFNYITDEDFLEIHNKNFYTATELNNLISVYDQNIYDQLVSINDWTSKYYANHERRSKVDVEDTSPPTSLMSRIIWLPNVICYWLFCMGRAIKRLDPAMAKEATLGFDPNQRSNLNRISNAKGGYQELIKLRFEQIFRQRFPEQFSTDIVEFLFPPDTLYGIDKGNKQDADIIDLFTKYNSSSPHEKSAV